MSRVSERQELLADLERVSTTMRLDDQDITPEFEDMIDLNALVEPY
jgi:hypothetical protein